MYILKQLLNGLGTGSIYALVALGYSMVYGIVRLINFAHGDVIMVAGYTIFALLAASLPLWLAIPAAVLFCGVLGVLIQRIAYQRLLKQGAPRIALLITAIGVSIFLQSLYERIYGSNTRQLEKMFSLPAVYVGDINIVNTLLNIAVAIIMLVMLQLVVNKTKIGKAMRATSEDPGAATLMGINTNFVIMFTFALGSALAAVGAVLYTNSYSQISPYMGGMLGLKAFVAAVLGGIGSVPGAMLGGLLIGVAEALVKAVKIPGVSLYADAVVFAMLILILLFKPAGILGKNVKEKV